MEDEDKTKEQLINDRKAQKTGGIKMIRFMLVLLISILVMAGICMATAKTAHLGSGNIGHFTIQITAP